MPSFYLFLDRILTNCHDDFGKSYSGNSSKPLNKILKYLVYWIFHHKLSQKNFWTKNLWIELINPKPLYRFIQKTFKTNKGSIWKCCKIISLFKLFKKIRFFFWKTKTNLIGISYHDYITTSFNNYFRSFY